MTKIDEMIKEVRIIPRGGTDIETISEKAFRYAASHKVKVTFNFNGIEVSFDGQDNTPDTKL